MTSLLLRMVGSHKILPSNRVNPKVYPKEDRIRDRKDDPGILIQVTNFFFSLLNRPSNNLNHRRSSLELF